MLRHFDTLIELFEAFPTEQHAIDHLTAIRWRNGRFCPLCGNADGARIGTLTGSNTHKCYVCRQRFSIRVGTIFQDTKLPLRKWFVAIWLINAHPKGIASTTLAKDHEGWRDRQDGRHGNHGAPRRVAGRCGREHSHQQP